MATLAEVIDAAETEWGSLMHLGPVDLVAQRRAHHQHIAAAVAAHLTSPEVVERIAAAMPNGNRIALPPNHVRRKKLMRQARAAITAALGEHEGVGRG